MDHTRAVTVPAETALKAAMAHPGPMDNCARPYCRHVRHLHDDGGPCGICDSDCPQFLEKETGP